jgi:thioredoxin-related protein
VEVPYIEKVRAQYYPDLLKVASPLSNENFKLYGSSTSPTLVLVDKAGIVRLYHPGKMTAEELLPEIEKIL